MRRLVLLALLCGVSLAPGAGAATVDPSKLVLRQSDVPASYVVNPHLSGPRTAAQDSVGYPGLKAKYASWGRLGGYQIRFDKGKGSIVSRADVFSGRTGTRQMLAWFVTEVGRQSQFHLRPTALPLGDEGTAYSWSAPGATFTVAVWRYRRVFSVVGGDGFARASVLALARTQQRRVAAALG